MIRTPRQCADESDANATILAREVGLDMVAYWQPTAASYFDRISKERVVQAVRDGASEQAAQNIARMKKPAMAEAAEAALACKGWLPALLATSAAQDCGVSTTNAERAAQAALFFGRSAGDSLSVCFFARLRDTEISIQPEISKSAYTVSTHTF